MRPTIWAPAFERITKGLHAAHDNILSEPLPERWVDLINHLNAQDDEAANRSDETVKVQPTETTGA